MESQPGGDNENRAGAGSNRVALKSGNLTREVTDDQVDAAAHFFWNAGLVLATGSIVVSSSLSPASRKPTEAEHDERNRVSYPEPNSVQI
jgi:hypothetical protein